MTEYIPLTQAPELLTTRVDVATLRRAAERWRDGDVDVGLQSVLIGGRWQTTATWVHDYDRRAEAARLAPERGRGYPRGRPRRRPTPEETS